MKALFSLKDWFAETHGTTFELVRHFFSGMFDSELFSVRGQWRGIAIGALALALPAGFITLDSPYFYKGLDRIHDPALLRAGSIGDEMAWLTLAFSITGLVALLSWQSLLPGRRDFLLLAGLPVRNIQIFLARFLSVAMFALCLVTALNLLPAFMTPHQFTAHWDAGTTTAERAFARFVPAFLGCTSVFFGVVSLQAVILNVTPRRWFMRLSTLAQGALVAVFLLSALSAWFILDMRPAALDALLSSRAAAFPLWFTAMFRVLLGDPDPLFARLADRARIVSAAVPAFAVFAYLVSYRRSKRLLLEQSDAVAASTPRRWNLLGPIATSPRQEAILQFLTATLARSRTHRLVMLAYLGGGLAVMLNAVFLLGTRFGGPADGYQILQFIVLYWPIGFSVIMIAGLRHAFLIPTELHANWLFRTMESHGRREWMRLLDRFAVAYIALPILLIFAPVAMFVMGWAVASRMIVLQLAIALSIFDVAFYSWQQLPFTCSYAPGKRPLVALLAIWIAVLGVGVPVVSIFVATLSQLAELFWIAAPFVIATWLWLRHRRREGWGESKLMFEDIPDAITDLGLRDLTVTRGQSALSAE